MLPTIFPSLPPRLRLPLPPMGKPKVSHCAPGSSSRVLCCSLLSYLLAINVLVSFPLSGLQEKDSDSVTDQETKFHAEGCKFATRRYAIWGSVCGRRSRYKNYYVGWEVRQSYRA